jgi:hypothetical protein
MYKFTNRYIDNAASSSLTDMMKVPPITAGQHAEIRRKRVDARRRGEDASVERAVRQAGSPF